MLENSNFYHLSQRIFNQPVMIHPAKAEIIVSALSDRLGITNISRNVAAESAAASAGYLDANQDADSAYDTHEGCAIIQIKGTLVQKSGYLRPWSGMTGYDGIRQNLAAAVNDRKVKAIVLDIDSPGGEVAGCFDLVDDIYALRNTKPIVAICNEVAFSAAYAIASAAHRITIPRTGGVGSIGVICMHVDYSKAIKNAGIKVTLIQYGDRKSEGSEMKPLTDVALARIQKDIDSMGELFVETVARNRDLTADAVRETQAACFMGNEAVDIGLADAIIAPHLEFTNLVDTIT